MSTENTDFNTNIFGFKPEDIKVGDFNISGFKLGETGRGRLQTIVPCPSTPFVEPGLSKSGKFRLNKAINTPNYWIAAISTKGEYIRGGRGYVYKTPNSKVELLTYGKGATGAAGRTGSWIHPLLKVPFGEVIRVKPMRLEAYFLQFKENKVIRISYNEASALDAMDLFNLYNSAPKSKGDFISIDESELNQ
jgi:hypothetical protein